jgi:glycosyltransferase involved in cell wall biosynthesis
VERGVKPLNVVEVADVSALAVQGGAERALREWGERLAASGHRVRMVSRGVGCEPSTVIQRAGVRMRHFDVERGALVGFVAGAIAGARRAVAAELASEPADVLHLHQPLSGVGALWASRAYGLPSVYTFHSSAALEYRSRRGMTCRHVAGPAGAAAAALLRVLERACLGWARRIHVLSAFSAQQLAELHGIPRDRIAIVPGGVDLDRFAPAPDTAAVRRRLGLPPDRPVLLTVRNLEARMGLDVLLHAVARMRRDVPGVLLLVGGAGRKDAALRALAGELCLGDHVRFLGFVPETDLADHYRAADVFVLPTRELEGFGLVTIEALACGTPVVGTSAGATPEILSALDGRLVVPPDDPAALAETLVGVLTAMRDDRGAAADLRARCRRLAERRYDWRASARALTGELRAAVAT